MSGITGIEWTDRTWNPVVGCERVSPGCAHCYAKTLHDRRHVAALAGKQIARQYLEPFETVQLKPERLAWPLSVRTPQRIFVNSVSDLFHEAVPDAFIAQVFAVMARAHWHTFQVLTKRPARMLNWFMQQALVAADEDLRAAAGDRWPLPNVWLGVSVENQRFANERIPLLLQTPAAVRFLSCEPLLGPVTFRWAKWHVWPPRPATVGHLDGLKGLDWIIAGGESGAGARSCEAEWLRAIRDQCREAGVAFFLKQLGGERDKRGHDAAVIDGERWSQMPAVPANDGRTPMETPVNA